ncbi:MAG: hypothetical protein M1833_006811 [Piccolia ochrophora]|nr:MAG: hypothetical protein M1833_006811 [Piccolia ochrophora]
MPTPTTEIVTFTFPPNTNVEDASTSPGKTWAGVRSLIAAQKGFQRAYSGPQVETSDNLQFIVGEHNPLLTMPRSVPQAKGASSDWDSLDAHKDFMNSEIYGSMIQDLMSIIAAPPSVFHVNFSPHPPSAALLAPAVEILTLFHSATISPEETSVFESSLKALNAAVVRAAGHKGLAGGWVAEHLEHASVDGNATAYVCVYGWESVDAHMAFRETESFKDNIGGLRDSVKGITMHHARLH